MLGQVQRGTLCLRASDLLAAEEGRGYSRQMLGGLTELPTGGEYGFVQEFRLFHQGLLRI